MIPAVNTTKASNRAASMLALGLLMLAAMPLSGCRGERTDKPPRRFFPDMDYQPKLKAQSETPFFEDGMSQRMPVEGTVPFAAHSVIPTPGDESQWAQMREKDRADMLRGDETYYFGMVAGSDPQSPTFVQRMPVEVDQDLIARGAERFNIYCSMCHGYEGLGGETGSVGRLMNVRPINLLEEKYRDHEGEFGSDGYIFHVIREGLWAPDGTNRMPAYGYAVDEQDAWAIVSYIRVLQAAFDAQGNPTNEATTSTSTGGDE